MYEMVVTPLQMLVNVAQTITATFYQNGTATEPGTVTVGITDETGTVVVAALTATSVGATGVRTYALTAQTVTKRLTVTFVSSVMGTFSAEVEVVGAYLFSLTQARTHDNNAMSNTTTYPQAAIEEARVRILDEFEEICGVSFVPRYKRVQVDGSGTAALLLPTLHVRSVRNVEVLDTSDLTWDAYTAAELDDIQIPNSSHGRNIGQIRRAADGSFASGYGNIRVTIEYGHARPPLPITQAALMVLRAVLVPSSLSSRALQESGEFGTIQMARADSTRGWHYGIPFVDSVLFRFDERVPAIG